MNSYGKQSYPTDSYLFSDSVCGQRGGVAFQWTWPSIANKCISGLYKDPHSSFLYILDSPFQCLRWRIWSFRCCIVILILVLMVLVLRLSLPAIMDRSVEGILQIQFKRTLSMSSQLCQIKKLHMIIVFVCYLDFLTIRAQTMNTNTWQKNTRRT